MGVLSNQQINEGLGSGHVVCYPLTPENVRGSSIDLTLGEWYYETEVPSDGGYYNPFSQNEVERYFGEVRRARPHREWGDLAYDADPSSFWRFDGIPEDHPIIVLQPHQRILAHTHEFVGINPPGTTEMRARSSWGRNGIAVCLCAGWGDPGYINRWTMEVANMNDHAVPLPVGERIAQLIFHTTGPVDGSYGDGTGKYQVSTVLEDVVSRWDPSQMLPRSYKDERKPLVDVSVEGVHRYQEHVQW